VKKVFLWLFLIIVIWLCIRSGLNIGKKNTIIDVMNNKTSIEISGDKVDEDESNVDDNEDMDETKTRNYAYYTSTNPVDFKYTILDEQLISTQMVLLKETSPILDELDYSFDFEMNSYLLLNTNYEVESIEPINLSRYDLSFDIEYGEESEPKTILVEIDNINIVNISCVHFE
jgi:hypothetical protein